MAVEKRRNGAFPQDEVYSNFVRQRRRVGAFFRTLFLLATALGVAILALLVLRQPLLVILLAVAAYVQIFWGKAQLDYIIEDMWVGLDKEVILSIPLFILCGNVMTKGTTAKRLIRILSAITRPLPGGMAVACIRSCAIFAAISGSSIVRASSISTRLI